MAENTAPVSALSILPGGTPADAQFTATAQERWYVFRMFSGRSYCIQTEGGAHFDSAASISHNDTYLYVFRNDTVTSLGSSDDATTEPGSWRTSRVCFVAPTIPGGYEIVYVKIVPYTQTIVPPSPDSFNFRVSVTETTLFSNWWYIGGDYHAYTLIRNTTGATVSYTCTWRGLNGAVLGTYSATVAGNATAVWDPKTPPVPLGASQNGSMEIAHNGSADALFATTTTFSATTGVGFDTFFQRRK